MSLQYLLLVQRLAMQRDVQPLALVVAVDAQCREQRNDFQRDSVPMTHQTTVTSTPMACTTS